MGAEDTTMVVNMQQLGMFDHDNDRCQRSHMEFHERIRKAREATCLTQGAFAALVSRHLGDKFSQQAQAKIEKPGSKSSKATGSIAAVSGFSLDWLLREEGPMRSSQPVSAEAAQWATRRDELGLTNETVHARLLALPWPEGIEAPDLQLIVEWLDGRRRPVDMIDRGMLYKALELNESRNDVSAPEAQTQIEQEYLNMIRTGTDEEAAAMLLAWKTARNSQPRGKP